MRRCLRVLVSIKFRTWRLAYRTIKSKGLSNDKAGTFREVTTRLWRRVETGKGFRKWVDFSLIRVGDTHATLIALEVLLRKTYI
jgi:hypothetical protein